MDIQELEQKYKFLKKVLKAYNEYDQPLANKDEFDSFYMNDVKYPNVNDKETYKDICIKLLRNLKHLKGKGYSSKDNKEYCTYLYHWLYKETEGRNISDTLISTIFDDFHIKMARQEGQNICPYTSYKKELYESKNLAKLSYLEHNFDNIKEILKNTADEHYCSCQKYLKDCVDIYIDMMGKFCTSERREKNASICYELSQFQVHYSFITLDAEIKKRIPDIQSGERQVKLSNCTSYDEKLVPNTESTSTTDASKSNTPSTVIGSMVGIPPFLVLMYKFTPVGKFFRFGNKNNTKITSNFDKEIEYELFHDIQKDSNIKDIQSKYNIGYEPI